MAKQGTAKESPKPRLIVGSGGGALHGVSCGRGGEILTASFPQPSGHQVHLWGPDGQFLGGFGSSSRSVCWYAEMSPDGRLVAAGFGDLTLRIWDVITGEVRTFATLNGIVASLAWSGDGKRLFTGNCGDNTVRLWDVASGTEIATAKTKKSATWFVALAPDGQRAVSGAGDKLVHVWKPTTGEEIAALAGHTGKILGLRFSPDGRRVASASQDKTIRVWDVARGKELAVLEGHRKQVTCVAFFPDGERLVSASGDQTLCIWNVRGDLLDTIPLDVGAEAVATTPDGKGIVAGCADGIVRVFDAV